MSDSEANTRERKGGYRLDYANNNRSGCKGGLCVGFSTVRVHSPNDRVVSCLCSPCRSQALCRYIWFHVRVGKLGSADVALIGTKITKGELRLASLVDFRGNTSW